VGIRVEDPYRIVVMDGSEINRTPCWSPLAWRRKLDVPGLALTGAGVYYGAAQAEALSQW